ncbi:OBAP family protein [Micrococcus luteus]|nr:OBAP family protein [Micrococcus luteus]
MSTHRLSSTALGFAAGLGTAAAVTAARRIALMAAVGKGHPLKHRLLDAASGLVQPKYPMGAMSTYLNGLHFYADDLGRQVEASHFCIHLRHDLHQCVIFDRNAPDARLIGIEYIISEERFRNLPDEERRLWHSHHYEVSSGALTGDGQVDEALLRARDERVGVDTAAKRRNRADIPVPDVVPGANSWERGRVVQTTLEERPVRGRDD